MNLYESEIKKWEQIGKEWVAGKYNISSFNIGGKNIIFSPKQKEFVNAKERYIMACGARGSGKTLILLIKLILFCLMFPGNRVLLGRETMTSLEKVTLPDLWDLIPREWVDYHVKEGTLTFLNGSQILLFGLAALQSGMESEIKKAEQKVKSLNLGAIFIDQLEEISKKVFLSLRATLRRKVLINQFNITTNPASFWGYDFFKINPPYVLLPDGNKKYLSKLLEMSMLENKDNLPASFVEDLLSVTDPEWVERYVYGVWKPLALGEERVFSEDSLKYLNFHLHEPIRTDEGIDIFQECDRLKTYRIGVDPSDGSIDPCYITCIELETGKEVASYSALVPVAVVAEKTLKIAAMYRTKIDPQIIIEVNGPGLAVLENVKQNYNEIYEREIFDYREKRSVKKLGWYTTHSSKRVLISKFQELLKKQFVKISNKKTYEELQNFIWSNESKKYGAGSNKDNHDDRVMGSMLAYFDITVPDLKLQMLQDEIEKSRIQESRRRNSQYQYQ